MKKLTVTAVSLTFAAVAFGGEAVTSTANAAEKYCDGPKTSWRLSLWGKRRAFTEGLEYKVEKVGGYKSLFLSGEGLVCRFSGQGRVWIQTRQVAAFTSWVFPFRPVKSRG